MPARKPKRTRLGTCKLCDEKGELCHGHILPKFGYRWLVTGNGGKFFNSSTDTLMTAQRKAYMFCPTCENKRIGKELDAAGSRLLMRFDRAPTQPQFYDENFYRWTVSLSLRVLCSGPIYPNEEWPPARLAFALDAINRWKAYLLHRIDGVGPFRQHAFLRFFGKLHRAMHWNFYPDHGFTFVKFGPLVVFGLTKEQKWSRAEKSAARCSLLTPQGAYLRDDDFKEGTNIPEIMMAISDESNIRILETNLTSKTRGPQIAGLQRLKAEQAVQRHRARYGESIRGG